ncbi:hypothetical protein KC361_g57 [Hortaea werneckii]|nr:hypothetical protein KC361_g57 [Hortaea werneckii]
MLATSPSPAHGPVNPNSNALRTDDDTGIVLENNQTHRMICARDSLYWKSLLQSLGHHFEMDAQDFRIAREL